MAKAKASAKRSNKASASSLSINGSSDIPKGMKALSGSFAPTWQPEKVGDELRGTMGEPKTVTLQQGKKQVERRCVEIDTGNEKFTVWESAGLKVMFDEVEPDSDVYIRFDGLGVAKRGQNAPKRFTVAVDG